MGNIAIQKITLRIAALGLLMVMLPFIRYSQSKWAYMVGISNFSSNQQLADVNGQNEVLVAFDALKEYHQAIYTGEDKLIYYVKKILRSVKLDKSISWTERVAQLMNQDIRLVQQI